MPKKERVRRPVSRVLFRIRGRGDDHSSGPPIAERFSRPTRTPGAVSPAKRTPRDVPIWSCSRRGLPCQRRCRRCGGLLPHPFTLPGLARPEVCFLWRFPSGRPGRKLSAAFSPWSPDFPRQEPKSLLGPAATARPSDGRVSGPARERRQPQDAPGADPCYAMGMAQSVPSASPFPHSSGETPSERDARLTWERERLAEAEDDIRNGRVLSGQAALDWLDRWAAGEELDEPPAI